MNSLHQTSLVEPAPRHQSTIFNNIIEDINSSLILKPSRHDSKYATTSNSFNGTVRVCPVSVGKVDLQMDQLLIWGLSKLGNRDNDTIMDDMDLTFVSTVDTAITRCNPNIEACRAFIKDIFITQHAKSMLRLSLSTGKEPRLHKYVCKLLTDLGEANEGAKIRLGGMIFGERNCIITFSIDNNQYLKISDELYTFISWLICISVCEGSDLEFVTQKLKSPGDGMNMISCYYAKSYDEKWVRDVMIGVYGDDGQVNDMVTLLPSLYASLRESKADIPMKKTPTKKPWD